MNVPQDPSAKLGNWGLTDIEKICNEAKLLNPTHAPGLGNLPEETCHDIGQNPQVGSSIEATQHTQIWKASLLAYPVWQLSSPRGAQSQACLGGALLDIVQVGESEDAIFLKICARDATTQPIQQFLLQMRLKILSEFGGYDRVDFLCKAMSDGDGGHVVILVPLAQLEKQEQGGFQNKLTGTEQTALGLPVHCVDTAKGCGSWMIGDAGMRQGVKDKGEASLRLLYDFVHCPGMYSFVSKIVSSST